MQQRRLAIEAAEEEKAAEAAASEAQLPEVEGRSADRESTPDAAVSTAGETRTQHLALQVLQVLYKFATEEAVRVRCK